MLDRLALYDQSQYRRRNANFLLAFPITGFNMGADFNPVPTDQTRNDADQNLEPMLIWERI